MSKAFISKRSVDAVMPADQDQFLWDDGSGAIKGFGLKVTPVGAKIYIFQYRVVGRRTPKRLTIGRHGSITPEQARNLARSLAVKVVSGDDPAAAKAQSKIEAVSLAFTSYSEKFISQYLEARWKRPAEGARLIRQFAQPSLLDKVMPAITRRDIHLVLDRAGDRVATKRNLFAVLRKMFAWTLDRGDIGTSPMEGAKAPIAPISRDRVLTDAEITDVWTNADQLGFPFGPVFRLLILTGQRRQEIAEMDWREVDLQNAEWCIPAARSKNNRAHIVPLSKPAVAILRQLDEHRIHNLVFTTTGTTPPTGWSKAKARLDGLIADHKFDRQEQQLWRIHDLRRSMATGLQKLGIRFEVTEAILNHVSGSRSGVAGIYQRYDWNSEKRDALERWGRHILALTSVRPNSAEIIPILSRA